MWTRGTGWWTWATAGGYQPCQGRGRGGRVMKGVPGVRACLFGGIGEICSQAQVRWVGDGRWTVSTSCEPVEGRNRVRNMRRWLTWTVKILHQRCVR